MGAPHLSQFGKYHNAVVCGVGTATAAGTGDNTAVTGATINRLGFDSVKLVIAYKTTLGSSETLKYAVEYQESADGNNWDTATVLQASTTAKTGVATGYISQVAFNVDLTGKKQYIRFNFTPDLSASGTDTAVSAAVAVLGGAHSLPVTQS